MTTQIRRNRFRVILTQVKFFRYAFLAAGITLIAMLAVTAFVIEGLAQPEDGMVPTTLMLWFAWSLCTIGFAASFYSTLWITVLFLGPLTAIRRFIESMPDKNQPDLKLRSTDELKELAQALNDLKNRL